MYRYDNYTDSFVRMDGEPNTGSTTVRIGVPLKETAIIVEKVELTDECIDKIADAVVQKLRAEQTEPQKKEVEWVYNKRERLWYPYSNGELLFKIEPQTDCGDFADRLAYERGVKHAWEVAQKVFDSTVTFYEAAKQIADTPQTEREGE